MTLVTNGARPNKGLQLAAQGRCLVDEALLFWCMIEASAGRRR